MTLSMTVSITMLCYYAACRILFTIMLNVIMLSVVMLSVVMLSVVAPKKSATTFAQTTFGPKSQNLRYCKKLEFTRIC